MISAKVSIVLTSYNHAKFIRQAIESIINQTYQNWELFIFDDASSDGSWEIIKEYQDPRIQAIRNAENKGPIFGFNKVIFELAQGEYFAVHHSDDLWMENKLELQIAFLDENLNYGAVFTNALPIDERGLPLVDKNHFYYSIFNQPNRSRFEWLNFFIRNGNALCHPSILIRRSCYQICGPYSDFLSQLPDFDMWIRLCAQFEIYIHSDQLVQFRILDGEMNTSGSRPVTRIRSANEYYEVIKKYKNIVTIENVFKIFPDCISLDRKESTDPQYILAQFCLSTNEFYVRSLLAIEIFFEIMQDVNRRKLIELHYNFAEKNLSLILGQRDIFAQEAKFQADGTGASLELKKTNDMLRSKIADQDNSISILSRTISELKNSTSWRITAPVRKVSTKVTKVKVGLRGLQSAVRKNGGYRQVFLKILKTFESEGIAGITVRFKKSLNPIIVCNVEIDHGHVGSPFVIPTYLDVNPNVLTVLQKKDSKIGVHLHLYYTDMMDEFVDYLNNIPCKFDLFISVTKASEIIVIEKHFLNKLIKVNKVVVEQVPNRGRNIAPFVIQFGKRLCSYDFILHIHTKKSPHNNLLTGWCRDTLNSLLGAANSGDDRVTKILNLISNNAVFVYPEGPVENIKDSTNWSGNYDYAKYILEKYTEFQIDDYPVIEFPEGFMFWSRARALEKFLQLPLSYTDFPTEPLANDGTLAHALERLILVFLRSSAGQIVRLHRNDSIKDYRYFENQQDFSKAIIHSDIKILAFYLPQFHPIPENDLWHGKDFTEWTKVKAANPLFYGHFQQHIPHADIGYYLLDSPKTLLKQAELMARHGVHGQVFYHYWFTGKLILEEPAQMLLANKNIKMPFCFCWANENWTRRWDGNEKEILLEQKYSAQDALDFIKYLIPYFKDDRYIKVNDRPMIYVYRPSSIVNPKEYLEIWKQECEAAGLKQPFVVAVLTRGATSPYEFGMDAGVERVLHDWTACAVPEMKQNLKPYRPLNGSVLSYDKVADFYANQTGKKDFTYFRSLVPTWDNTARYGSDAYVLHASTPSKFQFWLEKLIEYSKNNLPIDQRFILVNAWNEWAEGAHLEPDSKFGYSYLNSIGRALSGEKYENQLNPVGSIRSESKVLLSFSKNVTDQLGSDSELQRRFICLLQNSSLFERVAIDIKSFEIKKHFSNLKEISEIESDFILHFNKVCMFDSDLLEKMLLSAIASDSGVIANSYGTNSPLLDITENGSTNSSNLYEAPIFLKPANKSIINYRVRTDARCYVVNQSLIPFEKRPIVTTIIRFHKGGDFNELNNSLQCLLAMQDCMVIPFIAAQDLSSEQIEKLKRILIKLPWSKDFQPIITYFNSKDGKGDLRGLMLTESLKHIKTRYVAFLDYDDLLMPHAYNWLIKRLELTKKAISFGRVFSTKYNSMKQILLKRERTYEYGFSYEDFVSNNHAPLHSFIIDLSKVDISAIKYFENHQYMEDYYLTLQIFTEANCDWQSLRQNMYIGDYIHSVDRNHTLAFADITDRQALTATKNYKECEQRIREQQKKVTMQIKNV